MTFSEDDIQTRPPKRLITLNMNKAIVKMEHSLVTYNISKNASSGILCLWLL